MAKTAPRPQPSELARPQHVDPEMLVREWPSAGLCAEAQADGVPCLDLGCRCERCTHAAERFLHRPP